MARPRPSAHAQRDLELATVVCEAHNRSRRTYGAPRVHAELGRLGHRTARKRVARLMREYRLVGAHSRKKWRTGKPNTAWAPDLVERDFNPAGRDLLWAADVTQFRTEEGWLHFAGVIDLYSRRVVGWAMGTTPDADLVIDGRQTWPSRDLLRTAIFDYIEGFYNTIRIKQRLGYRSPAEFEQEAIA